MIQNIECNFNLVLDVFGSVEKMAKLMRQNARNSESIL